MFCPSYAICMENSILLSLYMWQRSILGYMSAIISGLNVTQIRVGKEGAEVRKVEKVKDEDKKEIIPF